MLSSAIGPLLNLLLTMKTGPADGDAGSIEVKEPHGLCPTCVPIQIKNDVTFHLYTNKNPTKPHTLKLGDKKSVDASHFDSKHETIIMIHGFTGSALGTFPKILSDAYLNHSDYNIIRVDWQKLSAGPFDFYPHAVANVRVVGKRVARFVQWFEKKQILPVTKLHVIGFSLGAHVAGFMGKALAPKKVARITGLDPAGPSFDVEDANERLDKSDATFVDIIHSNSEAAGLLSPIGHADFYPNQGTWQPGCIHENAHLGCSHRRSWELYAESISNEHGFPAFKCKTVLPIVDDCGKKPEGYMGFAADPRNKGIFLVHTNAQPPFAKSC